MKRPDVARKPAKYKNQKTVVDGVTFDSMAEARRWRVLVLWQKAGAITDLQRQVAFTLAPSVKFSDATRATPALRYVADFVYTCADNGQKVVNDCKGMRTPAYKIKRHLMLALLGIDILET